ncbi:MAG: hypothetical protein Q9179_004158 [Wetmoreana sp. 5 TL-2023]
MTSMEDVFEVLQEQWRLLRPLLPTYLHLLVSALVPIYAGAHASLTRPSSAAKPKPRKKRLQDDAAEDDSEEEAESKIEGLSASDAIWFPILAGCTLGGLYLIIKWLQDPALLNTVLNWYFAIFGVVGVAKMFKDSLDVVMSYMLPSKYLYDGQIWKFDDVNRVTASQEDASKRKQSPLPGRLSKLPLPSFVQRFLWYLRSSHSTLCIRATSHRTSKAHIHLTPAMIFSFVVALATVLYYNLIARPWYLTNILGFAFAYNALQMISPSTSWTGTLILASLFLYDIYFVFFTPLMVTVATQLDIPAKLLFPRPPDPDAKDPVKKNLSMLGLGDVVLPGMMIGFALRLDLYLFYLKKQKHSVVIGEMDPSAAAGEDKPVTEREIKDNPESFASDPETSGSVIIKPPFHSATSHWGTRFWTSSFDPSVRGALFPKPYFTASMLGYVIGMMLTLGIMQFTGHAQPALFYLVPCVLLGFWGTAFVKREVGVVWKFDESEEKADDGKEKEEPKDDGKEDTKARNERKSKRDRDEKQASGEGKDDGQKASTVDFLSLDLKLGWTRLKGTKGCGSRDQDFKVSQRRSTHNLRSAVKETVEVKGET